MNNVKPIGKHQQQCIWACVLCIHFFQNTENPNTGYCSLHARALPKYSVCKLFRPKEKVPNDDR